MPLDATHMHRLETLNRATRLTGFGAAAESVGGMALDCCGGGDGARACGRDRATSSTYRR